MRIPLLDLEPQHEAIQDRLDDAIARVRESQAFILGPEVEALEEEIAHFLGVPHAVGCASGTDALLLTLKALQPEPGQECIVPAFTFFATAGAVWNAGFKPVFCDIDPTTFNLNDNLVEAVWSERTRVVIAVHLFGQMAPMQELQSLTQRMGGVLLEDAAQAIGARQRSGAPDSEDWTMAGAAGVAGAFSFFPTKNLGAFGDGGLVATSDAELADRLRKLRVHGGRQMYHHEFVGTNSRLDALQAAVLREKLPYLDGWTRARGENACRYHGMLAGVDEIDLPFTLEGNVHVYNQYTIRAQERDELRSYLSKREIGTGVYYPAPLHLQPCFSELGGMHGQFPEAERACREVLSLPIYPGLGEERQRAVCDAIREFYQ